MSVAVARPYVPVVVSISSAPRRVFVLVGLAVGLTALTTLAACLCSGRGDPQAAYEALAQWDNRFYESVAAHGYQPPASWTGPPKTNSLAFFPGYPLAGRAV